MSGMTPADDRRPDARARPSLARAARGAAAGAAPSASCVVDDRRAARTRRCAVPPGAARSRRARAGGAGPPPPATPAGAPAARTGSPSSTTTSSPRPAGWRALAADLAAAGPDVGGRPGPDRACRCPPDRRPTDWERNVARARARPLGDGRPRLPARRAGGGGRLRRALPARLPRGRRPRAAGHRPPAGGSSRGAARGPPPGAPARRAWVSLRQAGRQRRRRADAARCTGAAGARAPACRAGRRPRHLAVAAAGALSLAALAARRPRVGAAGGRRLARRDRRAGVGADRPRPAHAARGGDDGCGRARRCPFAASGWWLAGHATLRRRLRAPDSVGRLGV